MRLGVKATGLRFNLRQWLATGERFGSAPEWYMVLRAAKYLGVAPWELLEHSSYWMHIALAAEWAEGKAKEDGQ
jgi:hypothetical protein